MEKPVGKTLDEEFGSELFIELCKWREVHRRADGTNAPMTEAEVVAVVKLTRANHFWMIARGRMPHQARDEAISRLGLIELLESFKKIQKLACEAQLEEVKRALGIITPIAEGEPDKSEPNPVRPLTDREHQILVLIGQGKLQREVAAELKVKEGTIGTHCGNIRNKLGLHSPGALREYAVAYIATVTGLEPAGA